MLIKAVPRAIARSARSFQSSASVSRVVATSPVKAEEVKVTPTTHYHQGSDFYFLSRGLPANTHSLNMNLMLSSCRHCLCFDR
jgi:hypothetical protein